VSDALSHILKARKPLTLSSVPAGFLPWLAADLARAAHGTGSGGRTVIIAADEAAIAPLQETVPVFAPEVEVLAFPAWDCLPYDRASPALRVMGRASGDPGKAAGKRNGPSC
jgi:transcription-repair coupling factor (superfamily II helicase)